MKPLKVLAVCGFGVGSSMVLKMTVEKAAKELGIPVDVENTDISTAKATRPDVIFTSNELADQLRSGAACPVFAMKRYTDKAEASTHLQEIAATRAN